MSKTSTLFEARPTGGEWDSTHPIMRPKGSVGTKTEFVTAYIPIFAHERVKGGTADITVALVHGPTESQLIGNARLIGAAPALLEALQGLRRGHKCWCQTWVGGEHEPECAAVMSAIALVDGSAERA